jgi:hypothetical protein
VLSNDWSGSTSWNARPTTTAATTGSSSKWSRPSWTQEFGWFDD